MNDRYTRLLSSISELLVMMIEAGAEIYRVEETAKRTLKAYHLAQIDIYATTSNINLSIETAEGAIKTHTRRIGPASIDIEKVHRLNDLARRISDECLEPEIIKKELSAIRSAPKYPSIISIFFYGFIAGAFYLFFGGRSLPEFFIATMIGFITGILVYAFDRIKANKFLNKFLCSFSACFITVVLKNWGIIQNADFIIIGNIMTLIPGTGLTNSIRDLFTGDSISGVLRLIEAALLALAIAGGYIITIFLLGGAA